MRRIQKGKEKRSSCGETSERDRKRTKGDHDLNLVINQWRDGEESDGDEAAVDGPGGRCPRG